MSKRATFSNSIDLAVNINMIKVMWCRFEQCLGTFTMLLVEGSSEKGLFRHLSNHVFRVCNFGNEKAVCVIFFSKIFKTYIRFQKCSKKCWKVYCFLDNCISIGTIKLCLLRTGYFSSAHNKLTSSPKIWQVNKTDFFQLNWLGSDQRIW